MNDPSWRSEPHLKARFHPGYPDDLQVIAHDGGPRFSTATPEAIWVHITAQNGDVYRGTVLNAPVGLKSVKAGDEIQFLAPVNADIPVLVTEKYLAERSAWKIHTCSNCGLPELFDAPSDLIRKVFPSLAPGEVPQMLTSFCPLCGGVQVLEPAEGAEVPERPLGMLERLAARFRRG